MLKQLGTIFSAPATEPRDVRKKRVLVLVPDAKPAAREAWNTVFKNSSADGCPVAPVVSTWDAIGAPAYSENGRERKRQVLVDVKDAEDHPITFSPDAVLVRAQVRGVLPHQDWRPALYSLHFGGVPSVNSLSSILNFVERPWVFGELLNIKERLGQARFPLINQSYYPTFRDMLFGPPFPVVVKVGHAHAGYGKMKIRDHHDFADFASVLAVSQNYCTAEPFLEGEYDLRIQKIGNHYRAFKRTSMGNWKTNTGTSIVETIPMTSTFKEWADEASHLFGGLDILAVDAIHTIDGKDYILEVNDTAIGLLPDYEMEDMGFMRDLILEKLDHSP